jgi:hypothetical protein
MGRWTGPLERVDHLLDGHASGLKHSAADIDMIENLDGSRFGITASVSPGERALPI